MRNEWGEEEGSRVRKTRMGARRHDEGEPQGRGQTVKEREDPCRVRRGKRRGGAGKAEREEDQGTEEAPVASRWLRVGCARCGSAERGSEGERASRWVWERCGPDSKGQSHSMCFKWPLRGDRKRDDADDAHEQKQHALWTQRRRGVLRASMARPGHALGGVRAPEWPTPRPPLCRCQPSHRSLGRRRRWRG